MPGINEQQNQASASTRNASVDTLHYADRPPAGYRLADNRQQIDANDMVYFPSSDKMDAAWRRPQHGENLIGSSVHESWPRIMGIAVPDSSQR